MLVYLNFLQFTMYTNIVLGLLTFAAVYLFGDEMMKVFTKDADVVAIGAIGKPAGQRNGFFLVNRVAAGA